MEEMDQKESLFFRYSLYEGKKEKVIRTLRYAGYLAMLKG